MTTDTPGVDLDAIRPATDLLIANLRETVGQVKVHQHPERGGDLYCLNLTSYMGERMGPVLRRLADEQAETREWQAKHTALADEFAAEADRLGAIVEAARYEYGGADCLEGECGHALEADDDADENTPCPFVETRYATAADAIEQDELRAEMELYRDAILHMLALAPDEYRKTITAARAAGSSEDYAKNNGRAEMIRTFATGLAERAGLPVADWEQIKQGIPTDGVYRAAEVDR